MKTIISVLLLVIGIDLVIASALVGAVAIVTWMPVFTIGNIIKMVGALMVIQGCCMLYSTEK